MSDKHSGYSHDASDKKLDQAAAAEKAEDIATDSPAHAGHDPAKIRLHDDAGKDRLFEGREQHDDADKASDRNRKEKDVARHHHTEEAAESTAEVEPVVTTKH
jgi:hypothetical protein